MGYARSRELYKAKGRAQIPFGDNQGLQQLIAAVAEQTDQTLQNITQSLGFAVRMPSGQLAFQPIAEYYQKTLDSAMLDISSGAFDYNTVLKRTVKEMINSGLRTVDYASVHSNRVEVAARRAVMTGLTQLTDKVTQDTARELETDMWEITWHSGARPTHWWGGRWYSSADLVKVCGYGTVTGLCGANCYHQKFPVIPGISEPAYTQEELDRLNAEEQKPREFGGKTYTKYEALQHQRKLETTMRAQRQEIKLLEDGGAAEDDVIAARARYRGTSAEYARFSQAVDLPQQRERVTVDGLGNIGVGKYTGGSDRKAMRQRVGSHITGTVSGQERTELLEHPRTEFGLTSVGNGGIIKLTNREAQLKHIFGERTGHIPFTPENVKLLEDTANNWENYRGKDGRGNLWHVNIQNDGSQIWVRSRNGIINEGGLNLTPITWDKETGLDKNPFNTGNARKEKKK